MKKFILPVLAIGLAFLFTQCEEKAEDNRTIITTKIQYDVPIVSPDVNYDWWIKNIEGSDREDLLTNIFERVLSGDVQAYDYLNKPLSVKQVETMLADTILLTLMRTTEPYAEYDTMIINRTEPMDIDMLRFLEEWKYDEESLLIDKKVLGICPVMQVVIEGRKITRPFFWVYFDEMK
jgi:hypothetical protein